MDNETLCLIFAAIWFAVGLVYSRLDDKAMYIFGCTNASIYVAAALVIGELS